MITKKRLEIYAIVKSWTATRPSPGDLRLMFTNSVCRFQKSYYELSCARLGGEFSTRWGCAYSFSKVPWRASVSRYWSPLEQELC